jgi:uncharacterized membrane-anchored protein YhcB (DUF1043 family)
MQENLMQAQTQPFVKLAQANMDLFSKFSSSPEVTLQATANATNLFQQATESATKLMHSRSFAHMVQGLMKNYVDFMMELSQTSTALLGQSQAALVRQTQEVSDTMVEAGKAQGRRARQAA